MEKIIKLIKYAALAFTGASLYYLGSEGEIGVNMQTVLATAPTGTLVIFTSLYELVKYVLPVTMVKVFISRLTPVIGEEGVSYVKQLAREKTPQQIVESIGKLINEFQELKSDVNLIRSRQEEVL